MGSIISIPIGFIIQIVLKLYEKLTTILAKNKVKNRFDLFDINSLDFRKSGILPIDKEWQLELPNESNNERVGIIGVNSWGQSLQLTIDWRPQTSNTAIIKVNFKFENRNGKTYYVNDVNLMPYDKSRAHYKAPGISLEILSPFRRLRLKFRGYMNEKDSKELTFVKIRLLWIAVSDVFDFECHQNKEFIESQLCDNRLEQTLDKEMIFENRFEQMGQMKGIYQIEDQNEEKLFLWGNKSKTIYDQKDSRKRIHRLFGYSKKGYAFHIGSVVDETNCVRYRYGFGYYAKFYTFAIESLSDIDLTTESFSNDFEFSLKTFGKTFQVFVYKGFVSENVLKIKINGFDGRAVYTVDSYSDDMAMTDIKHSNHLYFPFVEQTLDLVLPLDDRRAENVVISGGKGASLAALNYFADHFKHIEIPKGIVVTSNAYQMTIERNKQILSSIESLKRVLSKPESLRAECLNVSKVFQSSHLPQEVKDEIRSKLSVIFNEKSDDFNQKAFAVRSSALGEDSDDMSAAGQMTTYLGVRGLDEIYASVLKCWSSQFQYMAVEYRRGYGQDVTTAMAVVIQEMVDCDSAGVLFTCDPVSGDEREAIITANYGIGESVVSAMAEPDTIRVAVNIVDNTYEKRRAVGIKSISIGSKVKFIKMDESGSGTVVVDNTDSANMCCLDNDMAIRLTNIALEIQNFFGNVRDIEWAQKVDQIYILQSRPITNMDTNFTDYELMHEQDSGLPSEEECLSKANVGEVMPGCISSLSFGTIVKLLVIEMSRAIVKNDGLIQDSYNPYVDTELVSLYNQMFFNIKMSEVLKVTNSDYSKALILSIFGHELDSDVMDLCRDDSIPESFWLKFRRVISLAPYMVFTNYLVNKCDKTIHKERYVLDDNFESIPHMFEAIVSKGAVIMRGTSIHFMTSMASSVYNLFVLRLLSEEKNNPNLFTDFAYLMSQCGQLVSADVPRSLKQLANTIEDPKLFGRLSDEKALGYLMNNDSESERQFRHFLAKHGHRGDKEFDIFTSVWRDDPAPIIKSIKAMLSTEAVSHRPNVKTSKENIIKTLKTKLNIRQKFLLKYIVLPLARQAVELRERSKSLLVYGVDLFRQAMWALAHRMHSEGWLPEPQLLFHMTIGEIDRFIITRTPIIIAKAKQRQRLYQRMDDWKFDEFIKGYDFQPRHLLQNNNEINTTGDHVIKGTPVSVGRVMARVCVAHSLKDAVNIQPGDILITYCTDIGWSPYFPMIAGIATEIGGLISHGAVIAREYGLPGLVGVSGACHLLKTGDYVLLDCHKGFIAIMEQI